MFKSTKLNSSVASAALLITAIFGMGVDSCSEPKEYCKLYESKTDQAECTSYCENNKDFNSYSDRAGAVAKCQLGQLGYLSNSRISAAEAVLGCDRQFKDVVEFAKACRAGVTAEELRLSKSHKSSGTSNDRETGNNK
ncbi:MAG: hypothetical protein HY075_09140 [Deltaproteobacteria bacterium]|nr:hypothetical protein [Deltaproteobacteria bacterium]